MEDRTVEKALNCIKGHRGGGGWRVLGLGLVLWCLLFSGCGLYDGGEAVNEERERAFQRGKQLLREGRHEDALSSFLRVIERRPGDAAESHLEAADIYLGRMEDPVEAIYHFRRYLEQMPHSPQADLVRGQIDRAMKELVRTLPANPLEYPMERLDLLAAVEELENENRRLNAEIAQLRQDRERAVAEAGEAARQLEAARRRAELLRNTGGAEAAATTTASSPPPRQTRSAAAQDRDPEPERRTRTYTVRPGDSLYGISREVYGTGSRWHEIYEANRDRLPNENSVRAGMTLRIPVE